MPANERRPRREPCAGGPDWAAASERLIRRREPALRRARGVYATPRPLVLFVVRTAGALLRSRFGLPLGWADPRVRLLDPCAGPMNFVLEAWREAIACGARHGLAAERLLREHLLPHSQGIELLPGPHRLGRWAVRSFLAAHGIAAAGGSVPLALADALDEAAHEEGEDGEPEAIPVILGNPPYAGRSANRGAWISALLHGYRVAGGRVDEGYFRVDGRALAERNTKWLADDAVKFLRLAQWRVDRAGRGLVAFVVNHNVLDAPTFRGVRASLLQTFDELRALDLHGNRRKRERGRDGEPDENVFPGVAQGIAVLFLVKRPGLLKRTWHADLYGSRPGKLRILAEIDREIDGDRAALQISRAAER